MMAAGSNSGQGSNLGRWRTLCVLVAAVSLMVIDGTIVNVALPTMIDSVPLTFDEAEWIATVYALVFAAFLMTAGRLGDRYGRRVMFYVGLGLFTFGSLLGSTANDAVPFVVARAVQGLGATFVLPSTLSTVNAAFHGRDRTAAFAFWGASIAGAAAVGPLLGGWLTTDFTWRWVFGINPPLAAIIAVAAHRWFPETHGEQGRGRFDIMGLFLSALGFGGTVFALVEGRILGWWTPRASGWACNWPVSPVALAFGFGMLALAVFAVLESIRDRRGLEVLLDLSLFRKRSFSGGNVVVLVVSIGESGLLFVLPLFLQNIWDLSPIGAGWVLAAMALGAFASGASAPVIASVTSPVHVVRVGLVLEIVGVLGLGLALQPQPEAWRAVIPLVVYGAGLGFASAQLTGTILVDVPSAKSGQGSATQSTVRQLGSALGTAIVATVLATSVSSAAAGSLKDISMAAGLTADAARPLEDALATTGGGVVSALRDGAGDLSVVPSPIREEIAEVLAQDFTTGALLPIWVAAGFLLLGLMATISFRGREPVVREGRDLG